MTKIKSSMKIPIANIYTLIVYAYPDLYDELIEEEESAFESLDELLSEILLRAIARQLRKGLYKTYVPHEAALTMIRGKIDMHETIRLKTQLSRQLYCKFDEFDKNNIYNQILKSTCLLIIRQGRVGKKKRKRLRDTLFFFNEISEVTLHAVSWEDIRFHKDKISYRSMISLCYLIYKGVYEDELTGKPYITNLAMRDLYGRFLQHFYLKECPELQLGYQGKTLASIQEGVTGMKSALTVDMILSSKNYECLLNDHYDYNLLEVSKNPDSKEIIMEHMTKLLSGLKRMERQQTDSKQLYGVCIYPSLEENYLEEYPLSQFKLYMGAINLTMPFKQIRQQMIQIVHMIR